MRSVAILLFTCLIKGYLFGQPSPDKLTFVKKTLVYDVVMLSYECKPELYDNLLKSREILKEISPDTLRYSPFEMADYFYQVQFHIYRFQFFCLNKPEIADRNELFVRFRNYYNKKNRKHAQEQTETLNMMKEMMFREWEFASQKGNTAHFLEDSENKEWYDATMGNSALNKIFDSIRWEKDLYKKREILQSADMYISLFCHSVFSDYRCDSIQKALHEVNNQIEARELKVKQEIEQREAYEKKQQAEKDSIAAIIQNADDLFQKGQLAEALKLYESTKMYPLASNHSWKKILEIRSIQNKEYISRYYLFDESGKLRLDPSKSIGKTELKQLKANRELISAQLVKSLQQYDSALHKKELLRGNSDFRQLLPYRIKDTTRHLYQITCDSSGILSINHTLLSEDETYGLMADSIIREALPSLFPYLKINDKLVHQYWIPIVYIPRRYVYSKGGKYCNCHFKQDLLESYNGKLECLENLHGAGSEQFPENTLLNEFYFVITEGRPLSPPEPPRVEIRYEMKEIVPKKKWWKIF